MTAAIAPHEGSELSMILAGTKPLAVIEYRKQPCAYRRAMEYNQLGFCAALQRNGEEGAELVVTLHKNIGLVPRYLYLVESGVKHYGIKEYHRKMGALFGYSPEDIELFINAEVDCDCSKCRGAK